MLSLFKTRDLYETGAFYRIEKKYREPRLWSFEVWPFSVKYGFYKAISIVILGSFFTIFDLFLAFFPEKSGLDVLNGAFYMSNCEFYILQQKSWRKYRFWKKIWLFAPNSRKNQHLGDNVYFFEDP